MPEFTISYSEILNKISEFERIRNEFIEEIDSTKKAIDVYQTGLKIEAGTYNEQLTAIRNELEKNKSVIEEDCNRVTNYLTRVSERAKRAVDSTITVADMVSTFEAIEGVVAKG